ncbi:MAG: (Fe-S)-binding protein [Methylomonas sp.]
MFDFMDMAYHEPASSPEPTGPYIPDAGECLRCGMCVSTCPTFRLFETDEETPRRRIRSIGKLLIDNLPIGPEEQLHLDNCLQCRACEAICPSKMAYGALFDQAQAKLKTAPKGWAKLALTLIAHKHWRTKIMPLLAIYLKSGLQKPLRKSGLLSKLGLSDAEALLGMPSLRPLRALNPPAGETRGRVALFTGCIAEHFDRETILAAIRLLNAIGYEVEVPPEQGCCGAIHQHNGQSAAALIANNIRVFNTLDVDALLHTSSGCGAMLSEYPDNEDSAEPLRRHFADISEFLLKHWPDDLPLQPLPMKAAVHEPCSQRNVLKNAQAVYALLAKIPGLDVVPLPDNQLCCGAGGSYMLTHPENADRLRQSKQQAIASALADVVVSSNYGCAAFLSQQTQKIEHPLALLARQLPG